MKDTNFPFVPTSADLPDHDGKVKYCVFFTLIIGTLAARLLPSYFSAGVSRCSVSKRSFHLCCVLFFVLACFCLQEIFSEIMSYAGKSDIDGDSPGATNKFLPSAAGALPDMTLLEEESENEEGGDKESGTDSPVNIKKGALTPPRSATNSSATAGTLASTSASALTPTKAQLHGQVLVDPSGSGANTMSSGSMDGADSPPPPAPSTKPPGGKSVLLHFSFSLCLEEDYRCELLYWPTHFMTSVTSFIKSLLSHSVTAAAKATHSLLQGNPNIDQNGRLIKKNFTYFDGNPHCLCFRCIRFLVNVNREVSIYQPLDSHFIIFCFFLFLFCFLMFIFFILFY